VAQVVGQVPRRAVAVGGTLGQALQANAIQFPRDCLCHLPRRSRLLRLDLLQHGFQALRVEGPLPGEQHVQDDAEAVDVGAGIDAVPLAPGLLRTHVRRGAGEAPPGAEVLLAQGQAEVRHHRLALAVNQDVRRLDVAVNQVALMRVVQGLGGQADDLRCLRGSRPALPDSVRQVAAFDELGDDVAQAIVGAAEVVHGYDAGVIEAGQDAGLGQVLLRIGSGADPAAVGHLDGHVAAQVVVVTPVDDTEAAFAQLGRDPIAAQPGR
jgi:hypothetical protein